ncbi:ATP-dependent endonuclease [Ectobacillus antri]|uniref:ATP-dependent endonuclease n=1 Tax=Ectobacillus antri TaxID=2486280 RepID=A0ABT6H8M0_9BACI|nr:ATP-dependent endonuclease [Ectobacillus antri]MDG4658631.1 ATP-dependent endonuclease [Ectobacillus antri]MDG5755669.1 ATP-dependent endonuclease [Ectobacillus antri]
MYISDLYIKNFRSIKDIHVEFNDGKNILIGKNNAGKSNIIKALDLLMGEKLPTKNSIEIKDFFGLEKIVQGKKITVHETELFIAVKLTGTVSEIENIQKVKYIKQERFGIEQWAKFEDNKVIINEVLKRDLIDFDSRDLETFERKNLGYWIRDKEEVIFYIFANREHGNSDEINLTYGMLVKDKIDEKYFRCFSISKNLRDSFVTSSILPAFREPANQLKINNWTWYGKLLKSLWESKSEGVTEEIKSQTELIRKSTDKVFEAATSDLKDKLQELINYSYISFRMLPNDNDDIYKNISIYVNDGFESNLSDKGSGIQSALIIGLFSYYCSTFHKTNSLLAVEEPELYLHPHARRMLSNKLDEFVSQNEHYNNQVIIATHSQEFIRNTEIENIIVVRKPDKTLNTKTYRLSTDKRTIQEIQKIKQLLWSKNSELFFADKVILVEGGEEYIVPSIADFTFNQQGILDKHNISVIKVGGKSQFGTYLTLLKDLGIDYFVIADFDYLENGLEQIGSFIEGFDKDSLSEIRTGMMKYKSDYKKSKEIRNKILDPNQSDAKALCYILDDMCSKKEFNEELLDLWEYLRPKVSKKVNYTDLESDEHLKDKVDKFLNNLLDNNVLILRNGELEDYYEKIAIEETKGVSGKELKVLKLLELVNIGKYTINELINIDEYQKGVFQLISIGGSSQTKEKIFVK